MIRILFVDDEPNVLGGLRRMLYPLHNQWEMVFASSGREALQHLAETAFDILVTDICMPEMSGTELLSEVRKLYPNTIRIVLSGTAESELTLRTATLAHQYLAKPCDAATLRSTVERAGSLCEALDDPALKRLISGIHRLPSLPAVYLKLTEVLGNENATTNDVAAIITQDLAMTAKVLQLVNSALFGNRRETTSVSAAISYLGVETVRSLVLGITAFSEFRDPKLTRFAAQVTAHGLQVGVLAREIAKSSPCAGATPDDCFAAGLLHDIGKLILADNRPAQFQEFQKYTNMNGVAAAEMETKVFGATHATVGAYLLRLWGLPDCVTAAVAFHHMPNGFEGGAIVPVHIADALAHNQACPLFDIVAAGTEEVAEQAAGWKRLQGELSLWR